MELFGNGNALDVYIFDWPTLRLQFSVIVVVRLGGYLAHFVFYIFTLLLYEYGLEFWCISSVMEI